MTYFGIVLAVVVVAVVGVVAVLSLVLVLNNVYSSRSMGLGDFSLPCTPSRLPINVSSLPMCSR